MRFPYRGAGTVLLCGNKILLGKRSTKPFLYSWCIPGGGHEGNETDLETAIRETYEETGIKISGTDAEKVLASWTFSFPFFRWTTFVFRVQEEIKPRTHEFSFLQWIEPGAVKGKKRPLLSIELRRVQNLLTQSFQQSDRTLHR